MWAAACAYKCKQTSIHTLTSSHSDSVAHTHPHNIPPLFPAACWARNHTERPSFSEILGELNMMEEDEFFSTTSDEVFRSIQSSWKGKIRERFQELKKVEMVS